MELSRVRLWRRLVSKTVRLSMIATLMLGTTVLAVMSYNILNLKE
jgi:hypothetical protein